jgi:hypothetical protein
MNCTRMRTVFITHQTEGLNFVFVVLRFFDVADDEIPGVVFRRSVGSYDRSELLDERELETFETNTVFQEEYQIEFSGRKIFKNSLIGSGAFGFDIICRDVIFRLFVGIFAEAPVLIETSNCRNRSHVNAVFQLDGEIGRLEKGGVNKEE